MGHEPSHRPEILVVVPYFNEERWLAATLGALAEQSDREYCLVLVDNASTDGSSAVVETFARANPGLCLHRIEEGQKGTGSAADTGFRYAIDRGARVIARTDADCLPARDWVKHIRRAFFEDDLEFVAGVIRPRSDEAGAPWLDRFALNAMIWIAERYVRLTRNGRQHAYPYFLVCGNNLAITPDLYLRSGGFPRTRIEDVYEDRALGERVRGLTRRAAQRSDIVVYNSARRVRAYGYLNTLRWYRNHGYRHAEVDIR